MIDNFKKSYHKVFTARAITSFATENNTTEDTVTNTTLNGHQPKRPLKKLLM
jgi:hypothetical protein